MKTFMKLKLILPLFLLAFIFSCNNSDSDGIDKSAPTISVRLVDAPGDYKAVNVNIVDVMIKMNDDSDDESGWISLNANNETVNLLDFTGGLSKVLVDRFPIPAGTLSQMRLVLGDGNTIVIENEAGENEFDLKTPSAQQSGLKLKVNAEIEEGFTYDFVLDFDVEKSIVNAGSSGNIILKPVLYVSAEVSSGIIEGTITPSDVPVMVSVLVDDMDNDDSEDDFIISAYTDENGDFALWGVPAGTYEITITPLDETSDYGSTSLEGVVVTNGSIKTLDAPITLELKPGSISGDVTNDIEVTAEIKISGTDTVQATVMSNASGEFEFENIPPGNYTLTISVANFEAATIEVEVLPGLETVLTPVALVAL
ncbi:DUF4382 domain-containing protein [Siansivirga zeaxanthinifaciens]|uniref:Carbohydrate-binding protein n=1 Tax=Siansivirga zeaxanthinifaciens CC-SAMT-1 TaxID=1454006 RepID=A0A0C5WJV8_9FLAO|nr:DUF4382 domain-containing protein [Siansivirga zeaxanthinifaciens]AJR03030.1 carbohydrate-binding protein [Siansivirga zeaxanthinifaciens CC-SAMT-1]